MNVRLLRFREGGEHVDVPLSKLVNPTRDLSRRLGVHNDVAEPFLEKESVENLLVQIRSDKIKRN